MSRKLERAANKTKTWKDKVAKHEGLVRLIQPGRESQYQVIITGYLINGTDQICQIRISGECNQFPRGILLWFGVFIGPLKEACRYVQST